MATNAAEVWTPDRRGQLVRSIDAQCNDLAEMSQVGFDGVRCLEQVAFSGRILDKIAGLRLVQQFTGQVEQDVLMFLFGAEGTDYRRSYNILTTVSNLGGKIDAVTGLRQISHQVLSGVLGAARDTRTLVELTQRKKDVPFGVCLAMKASPVLRIEAEAYKRSYWAMSDQNRVARYATVPQ